MQLTYGQTWWYGGIMDRQDICLTYGWTFHVEGCMMDRCIMWLTYGWTGHLDGMTDRWLT